MVRSTDFDLATATSPVRTPLTKASAAVLAAGPADSGWHGRIHLCPGDSVPRSPNCCRSRDGRRRCPCGLHRLGAVPLFLSAGVLAFIWGPDPDRFGRHTTLAASVLVYAVMSRARRSWLRTSGSWVRFDCSPESASVASGSAETYVAEACRRPSARWELISADRLLHRLLHGGP